jgi:PII-like signaling protein
MRSGGTALLLRIFLGESGTHHGKPLHHAILELLRDRGVAGATVVRGIEGFGARAHIHTDRILRLSEDLPIVIEVVDDEEHLRPLIAEIDAIVDDGLITTERVEVVAYRARSTS